MAPLIPLYTFFFNLHFQCKKNPKNIAIPFVFAFRMFLFLSSIIPRLQAWLFREYSCCWKDHSSSLGLEIINRRRLQRNLQSRKPMTEVLGATVTALLVNKHSCSFTVRNNPDKITLNLKSSLCLVEKTLNFTLSIMELALFYSVMCQIPCLSSGLLGISSLKRL